MKKIQIAIISLAIAYTASADNRLDELAELQQGIFDSAAADPGLSGEQRLVDKRIRVAAPLLGNYVFYQQINHLEDLSVYRQRILILRFDEATGRIEQLALALKTPERYVNGLAEDFASLGQEDLEEILPKGCELVWTATGQGFKGRVDPDSCVIVSSRTGKLRRIEAESILTEDALLLAERGFDADSREQLFGTDPDEYLHLGRID